MIERCTDYRRIKKFPDWRMLVSHEVFYLMEVKDGKDLGVWTLHPWRDGLLVHVNLGDGCKGKDAKQSAIDIHQWIFANTHYKTIYAKIHNDKRPAQFISIMAGMKFIYSQDNHRFYKITPEDWCMDIAS